jgi:tetrahydromethanopterin S-methyltransferase subunit A
LLQVYGSESWTNKIKDINRIKATHIRYRPVKGCSSVGHITDEGIRRELHIHSVKHQTKSCTQKLIRYLDRLPDEKVPNRF